MKSLPIRSYKRIAMQTIRRHLILAYATLAIIVMATHALFVNAPVFRIWEVAEDVFLFGITALLLRTVMKGASISLRRYSLLVEHSEEIALFVGPDRRILDVNEAATRAYGYSRSELIGLPLESICRTDEWALSDLTETSGATVTVEAEHDRKDGTRFPVEISAVCADIDNQACLLVLVRDVTPRRRRQEFERLVHEIDRRILKNERLDELLAFTCSEIARLYDYPLVQLSLKGADGRVTIRQAAGPCADFLEGIEVRWDDSPAGCGPTGTAIRTGEMQWRELSTDPQFVSWRARALANGLTSALAIPLVVHERVLGAITIFLRVHAEVDPEITKDLIAFADQIAISIAAAWDQRKIRLHLTALESAANAIVITGPDGVIQWVNPAFAEVTGYSSEEAIGRKPSLLKSGSHGPAFYRQMWSTIGAGMVWRGELHNRRKDGSIYIDEQTITPVRDADGQITNFIAVKQDITAKKRQEDLIRHVALHDPLTDLPNRRAMEGAIERLCQQAKQGKPGTLVLLDVDNLKIINDAVGHFGGDQILAELAGVLRTTLRPADFFARFGGDKFAVLLHQTTAQQSREVAERLRAEVDAHQFHFGGFTFDLTISMGIVSIDGTEDSWSVPLAQADTALYTAKEQGKNRVVVYRRDGPQWQLLAEASRWVARIKAALRENRFVLYYQPVVNLGNGLPEHYEALIRMLDVDGTIIPAKDFIPAAERFGLMPQIDRWVVENVTRVLRQTPSCRIFVNLSGASLGDAELLQFIAQHVRQSGVSGRLAFEITESAALTDIAAVQSWIHTLKELGCLFALDDFGVGFSSFAYLRALAVDYVKIDQSFVKDLDRNPTTRALVQAVKSVATTLGKDVIAEGVETEAHAATLVELGIELAQGYHCGRPEPDPFEQQRVLESSVVTDERRSTEENTLMDDLLVGCLSPRER